MDIKGTFPLNTSTNDIYILQAYISFLFFFSFFFFSKDHDVSGSSPFTSVIHATDVNVSWP